MKFLFRSVGVVFGLVVITPASGAQPPLNGPSGVLQLRLEIEKDDEALATAVLVHREDGPSGVMLYFLTSENVRHPLSVAPPPWEFEGDEANRAAAHTRLSIAVLRIRAEKSALVPTAVTLDSPPEGASFFIVGHTTTGGRLLVPQRVQKVSTRAAMGDVEMSWAAGCVGAPAFTGKGVFGIVSDCGQGQPPTIALLSAARDLLCRLVPGLDLDGNGVSADRARRPRKEDCDADR
jgi:hypothetical protein